jgi:hypothetical protein
MFLFNWFKPQEKTVKCNKASNNVQTKVEDLSSIRNLANEIIPPKKDLHTTQYVIRKVDYEAMLERMNHLEDMVSKLSSGKPQNEICIKQNVQIKMNTDNYQTPFQQELKIKMEQIRQRMGESHGFENKNHNDLVSQLEQLEQSVMEQSLMTNLPNQKKCDVTEIPKKERSYLVEEESNDEF